MPLVTRAARAVTALATGLALSFRVMLRRKVTVKYPIEKVEVSRVLTRFDIEMDKCCYCGYCVEVCPTEAIVFVPHYEASTYNRDQLLYDLDDLHRAAPKEPIARGIIGGRVP